MASLQVEKTTCEDANARERRKEQNRIAQRNLRKRRQKTQEQQQQQQQQKKSKQAANAQEQNTEDDACPLLEQAAAKEAGIDCDAFYDQISHSTLAGWDASRSRTLSLDAIDDQISFGLTPFYAPYEHESPSNLLKRKAILPSGPQACPTEVPTNTVGPLGEDQGIDLIHSLPPNDRPQLILDTSPRHQVRRPMPNFPVSAPQISDTQSKLVDNSTQADLPTEYTEANYKIKGPIPPHTRIDSDGKTALHLCTEKGHASIVRYILDSGAKTDTVDASGLTSLHYAAINGHLDVTAILLEAGADIDALDPRGWSALHMAADAGHDGVVRLLVDEGADLNATINKGPI